MPFHVADAHDPSHFLNAREAGATGDWRTDDTKALQAAISRARTVFLPFGTYRITDTLHLRPDTQLVGEGLSRIVLGDHAPGFGDTDAPKAVVSTPTDGEA